MILGIDLANRGKGPPCVYLRYYTRSGVPRRKVLATYVKGKFLCEQEKTKKFLARRLAMAEEGRDFFMCSSSIDFPGDWGVPRHKLYPFLRNLLGFAV